VDEESDNLSICQRIYICVAEALTQRPSAEIRHKAATADLLKELSYVRAEVLRECRGFQKTSSETDRDESLIETDPSSQESDPSLLAQRRRLLFLFVKDLSSGVSGEALSVKSERDRSVGSLKARARLEGVSWRWQCLGWVFVLLLNCGLLFYVFLFALRQTHSRQSAWFKSFVLWLVFEVTVSSTGLVLLTHLLVPLCVSADVSRLKERVLRDLIRLRKALMGHPRDIEEGGRGGTEDEGVDGLKDFNAAKYLFPSWRLACLFPELPESGLILLYSSPWPKRRFGETGGAVSIEYEQAVILTALSRILLYFLGSLLRFPTLVQDIVLQTLCNSGLGFVVLLTVRLFAIHPALPVAVGVSLLLALVGLLRISSGKSKDEEDHPVAAEPLNPAALSATPRTLPTERPPLSPPSEVETPLLRVEEGVPVGSGSDDETNQTSASAGEEQCGWNDDDKEDAAEMARLLESSGSDESNSDSSGSDESKDSNDSSGSDESKDSDDSSGDWDDVHQTDSW
jgi:hypothetical protein